MDIRIREGTPADAEICGRICYDAFKAVSEAHGFAPDFPAAEVPIGLLTSMLANPKFYGVVAEIDGRVVGSNFLDERNPIAGVRLIQAGFHTRSLALYAKLGYDVREHLACMQGNALNIAIEGHIVRPAAEADVDACNRVCRQMHGHERDGELRDAIARGTATVVEHDGRVTGYATIVGFFGHAVGETNADVKALIGAAKEFAGPGFLLPTRNGELFRWCLRNGLRVTQPMTLMSKGLYNEPAGAFLPSILY